MWGVILQAASCRSVGFLCKAARSPCLAEFKKEEPVTLFSLFCFQLSIYKEGVSESPMKSRGEVGI